MSNRPAFNRRVVVTGLGIVSPLGNDLASSWDGIVNGRSGIGPVTHFDASAFTTRIAGQVRDFDVTRWVSAKDARKMDPFIHYGVAASMMAMEDAGLVVDDSNAERIGALIGSGIGGILGIEEQTIKFNEGGPRKISPFYVPSTIINMLPGQVSLLTGIKGPNFSAVSACATSNHSIGMAMRMIQYGDADVMIAGGAERGSSPTSMGGFCAMKAMSTRNDDPAAASRPWDKERDGFVLGDGAGILVLEEYERAKARGARIYCELAGFGASSDAFHMTAPSENGEGPARCMTMAFNDAGINPDQIGYLNAHGTSTPLGDLAETLAIKRALGDHAYRTMVSSTKSMTGHLLGAAGGAEAIFSVLALHHGVIPPTINLEEAGDGCDLDYVPNVAREAQVDVAVSNGFGFGGTNGTLVFRRL
ncbi:MAG: beta-ketoacyl-ACP synthase II [Lysobacter sp.]|jgi:3-oxoacyl-[acyl-carrier-protein] synthase II|uniref:3-oxoacyl-[acyl-carrier-protein] synthase 2 n=2 Tax=Lysobacteraceae TaxID=32033 RepID=A0ABU7YT59_9GAMM|nr:beta-ketoacyl-ACP synthase II [Lysobacter luteus]MDV3256130.1 beta-ketoacyl-ACP synthase II [Lysobacter sp.]MDV5982125.1 beta-ketoacyl-ACP synthase II [Lysobacter sp.]CAG4971458.1 3-oxoacyl-[acyl-carrier-protein] synthase 2 [Lysobacter luteus]